MAATKQIRLLTLNAGENLETTLYRLEKGWTLRFVLGPSLHASTVRLFCNHPLHGEQFTRSKYDELNWQNMSAMKSDRHDSYAELRIVMSGTFSYFFTIDQSNSKSSANGKGSFLVDPTLHLGPDDDETEITLDCLQCQTVLSKNLGSLDHWLGRLMVARETGYNMIHFTPIQELGVSNSAYSLKHQNRINPTFHREDGTKVDFSDIEALVNKMKGEWGVLSLIDLVYNHTAINSDWLWEHPECAYNLQNSPHLRPAYVVDRILYHFNEEVARGKWAASGVPSSVKTKEHLAAVGKILLEKVFPAFTLEDFYSVDIEKTMKDFIRGVEDNRYVPKAGSELEITQDPEYRRKGCTVNMDTALKLFNKDRPGATSRQDRINACCDDLRAKLRELNNVKKQEMDDHIHAAVGNFLANARYRFLADDGPKIKEVSRDSPLMYSYFVQAPNHVGSVTKEEEMMNKEGHLIMATNGWVMGDDPLRNFAEWGSNIYLRRELVNWGDSVKLRYGKGPGDCPYLWNHMTKYTETMARIFHGVRLDNCHSTPLHVAEYMMDVARQVRPDLYVIAELFTGSEYLDNMFINRLGINSLIREALMAPDAHEEGRLIHRYGGSPVGAFIQPQIQPLSPTVAHAMLFDQTHDNMCPIEVRSVYDLFPSAALVAMAFCASGSNRGYDELVPHHIHVVDEKRLYTWWSDHETDDSHVNTSFGIIAGKKALNRLHYRMASEGFNQVYVDQIDGDTVSVTRHNPKTHESIVLIARTAFRPPANPHDTGHIRPLSVPGKVEEIILEGRPVSKGCDLYKKSKVFINGLPEHSLTVREYLPVQESGMVRITPNGNPNSSNVLFHHFPPGSVVAMRVTIPSPAKEAILEYRKCLKQFGFTVRTYSGRTLSDNKTSGFRGIVSRLKLCDLNRALYRCDPEERDDGKGFGAYNIPNFGATVYCGLQGVLSVLSNIRPGNDLGHPLCGNLRDGDWLPGYIVARLKIHPGTRELSGWFENVFDLLKKMPRYLIPCYFDAIVAGAYMILKEQALSLMSDFINDGSTFIHALAMGSVQFCGVVKTSPLPELSPLLHDPPPGELDENEERHQLTLSAGFPHFASGYMRCWGRDTFIALRGLLLLTGRYQEARAMILGFGSCMRHGLIPNLLGGGVGARFNCRDAVWWWLQCIQDYVKLAPNGISILKDPVTRLFPQDDSIPQSAQSRGQQVQQELGPRESVTPVEQPLCELIQESLQRHALGVAYRERNAGRSIDSNMDDPGFNVEVGVRWETGFVYGGNVHNCGTWMDKMGGSEKAGNRGKPATPRDGSAVELIGLSKSAVTWLDQLNRSGQYPYSGVDRLVNGTKTPVSFNEWSELIQRNFERYFWVNLTPDVSQEEAPELINRRGIYRDTYKATLFWSDTQLRPNFCVSMVVAPELFSPDKAWQALTTAQEILLGPLGMKTLDPEDWAYCGDYINSDDSGDPKVANGFNYHQGPEWVWPVGYFLRAKLLFAKKTREPGRVEKTVGFVKTTLTKHYEQITTSPWQSLPELTNSNGKICHDSCPAQAWSVATILDVLHDLEQQATSSSA